MHLARSILPPGHRHFGRGRVWLTAAPAARRSTALSDDLKLFATTFAAGFLFVTLLIA